MAHSAQTRRTSCPAPPPSQEGYLLIALVVAIFLMALFLTIAAPTMARSLERDKEVESKHRALQYVRAIHNYYAKFKTYPTSIDVLLNQNNQHFLRQQYKDPLTGEDYRLIHFGEAKTTVKGFFGEELQGFAQGSLGTMAGSASGIGTGLGGSPSGSGGMGAGGSSFGSSTPSSFGNSFSSGGSSTSPTGSTGTSGSSSSGSSSSFGSSSTNSSGTLGGTSATQFQGSKGAIVGVGSNKTGHGIVEWNGSSNIEDWEFLYDPRVDLLKARVSIFGGSPGESGNGSLGSLGGSTSGLGSNTPSFGSGSGTGSSGTGSGSGFGSGSGSSPSGSSGTGSSFGNSFGNQPR